MNSEEIRKVLENNKKWFFNEPGGIEANLSGANLRGADLRGASLCEADLSRADLYKVNLRGANLSGANLRGADLRGAYLSGANLRGANLYGANLRGANLKRANLYEANLYQANLTGADLREAENIPTYVCPLVCPEEGSFIGFKKAITYDTDMPMCTPVIVKLKILRNAKRSSATSRKCRCNEAEVISITSLDGKCSFTKAFSEYDPGFIYEVGKIVKVNDFDEDRWNECSTGIHFFITRNEAVDY